MASSNIPKDPIIKLKGYENKYIRIKFQGGREITGVLKSHDQHCNIILDDAFETLRDKNDPYLMTQQKRKIGLLFARGTMITSIYLMEGAEVIENPFEGAIDDDDYIANNQINDVN